MISEAVQLLAPGIPVTLSDGKAYSLIFDFEALCHIEEECGSLEGFLQRIRKRSWRARVVRQGMFAGLAHTKMPQAAIVKLLDFRQVNTYMDAIMDAFDQAMPSVPQSTEEEAKPADPLVGSLGPDSTTSPPSISVEPTISSGA